MTAPVNFVWDGLPVGESNLYGPVWYYRTWGVFVLGNRLGVAHLALEQIPDLLVGYQVLVALVYLSK